MSIGEQMHGYASARSIDISDEDAIRYWSRELNVSRDELLDAIWSVGREVHEVAAELAKS